MAITADKVLKDFSASLPDSNGTLHTVTGARTSIRKVIAINAHASLARDITIYIVKNGGTAGTGNAVYNALSLAATSTTSLPLLEGLSIESGGTIEGFASATSDVTLYIVGVEYT